MHRRFVPVVLAATLLAGCWNGGNSNIRLGDVSLGQQLIDLERALQAEALTPAEYEKTRAWLLSLGTVCGNTEEAHQEES